MLCIVGFYLGNAHLFVNCGLFPIFAILEMSEGTVAFELFRKILNTKFASQFLSASRQNVS